MNILYKSGMAAGALLVAGYVAFSAFIFTNKDSGNSNARWVPGTAEAAAPQAAGATGAPVQAASANPELPAIFSGIMADFQAGQFDKAIASATQAIEKNPQTAMLYYFRGFANLQKKQTDEAIRDLDQSLKLNPAHTDSYRFRALAYISKGEADKAIADANKVVELDPNNPESYVVRVMSYMTKGDKEKAKPDVAKILQLDPNNAKAKILSQQLQSGKSSGPASSK